LFRPDVRVGARGRSTAVHVKPGRLSERSLQNMRQLAVRHRSAEYSACRDSHHAGPADGLEIGDLASLVKMSSCTPSASCVFFLLAQIFKGQNGNFQLSPDDGQFHFSKCSIRLRS